MATEANPNPQPNTGWSEAQIQEARERAEACGREVMDVLAKYSCQIVPFISSCEPVGQEGRRAMLTASYGIIPNSLQDAKEQEQADGTNAEDK